MNVNYNELIDACKAADRDWSATGSVSSDAMTRIRAALGDQQETVVEKSFALVEKMRKTLEAAT